MNSSEFHLTRTALWLLLLLLGVFLVVAERQETIDLANESTRAALIDNAGRRLSAIRRGAGRNLQVQNLFRELRERFGNVSVQHFTDGGRVDELSTLLANERAYFCQTRGLPRHRLITLLVDPTSHSFRFLDTGNDSILDNPGALALGQAMSGDHDRYDDGRKWLSGELGFSVTLKENRLLRRNLLIFTTFTGERGFFWDRVVLQSKGLTLYMGAILDLNNLPEEYGLGIIAQKPLPEGWGLGFVMPGKAPILTGICSSNLALNRRLEEISRGHGRVAAEEWDGNILLKSALLDGISGRVIVAVKCRDEGKSHARYPLDALFFASIGLAFSLAMVLTVERAIFNRGPRFGIGLVLMGSCLVAALLPTLGLRAMFRRTLAENLQNRQIGEARLLHKQMLRLEENVRFAQGMLRGRINELSANATSSALLDREARRPGPSPSLASWAKEINTGLNSMFRRNVETALMIGADGRQKGWTSNQKSGLDAMLNLVGPIWKQYLYQFEPRAKPAESSRKSENATLGEAAQREMTFDTVSAMMGPETMALLSLSPRRINEVRTSFVNIYLTAPMLKVRGMLRYIVFIIWSDWLITANYLEAAIIKGWNTKSWAPSEFMVKARPGLEFHWNVNAPLLDAWHPLLRLLELGKYARVNQTDFAPNAPGKPIMELYPSRLMTKALLLGVRPTESLYKENEFYQWLFWIGTFFGIIIAVLLARHATFHFLSPLQRLAEAVGQIGRGEYTTRLEADRQDEFGSLAGAFNQMARGLEEGELLGRYVSTSVREAVKDQTLVQQARQGELREITVLFSSLHGLDESDEIETDRLFENLEAHLDAFTIATQHHGGDIDKVIGEKVLVVFDHQRFGNATEAVTAALRVVKEVQEYLAGKSLETATGVNSGPVIAGILGAPTVRLDFTVIGDTVNLASRLSLLAHTTDGTRTVLSGTTLRLAGDAVRASRLPFKRVKGKTQEVEAFLLEESS